MFWHNFKYTLKTLLKNKPLIFWTFAFPILLATLYNMAFSNIEKNEKLSIIDIAVVSNDEFENNEFVKGALNKLSDETSKEQLFNITYTTLENSKKLLEDNKVSGYLTFDGDDVNIVVSKSGVNQTIIRIVIDEINSEKDIYESLINAELSQEYKNGNYNIDYDKLYEKVSSKLNNTRVNINDITRANISYTMIEYYNLIAMAALYGGLVSMTVLNKRLANMDSVGKRVSVSPTKKGSMLMGSLFASFIIEIIGLVLLFIYTIFVIKVDYGTKLPYILLLAIIGTITGLTLGVLISTVLKTHEGAKTGILISITMLWCFLSGMTGVSIKYIVDKTVPILNIVNPANMITDGLYSLYYYTSLDRYYFNIISLLIFSCLMIFISLKELRRQKYDSI